MVGLQGSGKTTTTAKIAAKLKKNKRILLVEDHPLNTEIAKRVLEKKKMIVYTAENGKVAVEKFKGSDLYGQVDLVNIYRSGVARLAEEMK